MRYLNWKRNLLICEFVSGVVNWAKISGGGGCVLSCWKIEPEATVLPNISGVGWKVKESKISNQQQIFSLFQILLSFVAVVVAVVVVVVTFGTVLLIPKKFQKLLLGGLVVVVVVDWLFVGLIVGLIPKIFQNFFICLTVEAVSGFSVVDLIVSDTWLLFSTNPVRFKDFYFTANPRVGVIRN